MFSFPQIDPETTGRVERIPIPLDRYLGASFGQGFHDSAFNSVSRYSELTMDNMDESSPMLDPETANQRYAVGDLKFTEPVREVAAQTMNERKRSEMDRQFLLANGFSGGRLAPGIAAQILGGVLNPLDLGLMFIPVVGQEAAAAKIAAAGGGALRQAIARGLITREMIQGSKIAAPRLAEAVIQGTVGQALFEVPNLVASLQDKANYTAADALVNVVGGGIFAGALHSAGALLSRIGRGTKDAMAKQAVNDFLRDQDIRVSDYVQIDEKLLRQAVEFDMVRARAEAIQAIGGDMVPIESWARAQIDVNGHLGEVDELNLVRIARDWIPLKEAQGKDATIARRLLQRVEGGERDIVTLQNLAARFDLAFNPLERKMPSPYHLGNKIDGAEALAKSLPLTNAERRAQAAQIQLERRQRLEELVDREFRRRVDELIERKRKEFDPQTGLSQDALREIRTQQDAGRILPPEAIERYMHQERFNEAEIAMVEKDIKTLEENALVGLAEDEAASVKKQLSQELEKLPEPQEKAIRAAADCILKKIA